MWAFLRIGEMGKGKRNQYWQQHEQAVDKMEKAKAKPLKSDREKVWQRASTDYLIANHFCQDCQKRGYTRPSGICCTHPATWRESVKVLEY